MGLRTAGRPARPRHPLQRRRSAVGRGVGAGRHRGVRHALCRVGAAGRVEPPGRPGVPRGAGCGDWHRRSGHRTAPGASGDFVGERGRGRAACHMGQPGGRPAAAAGAAGQRRRARPWGDCARGIGSPPGHAPAPCWWRRGPRWWPTFQGWGRRCCACDKCTGLGALASQRSVDQLRRGLSGWWSRRLGTPSPSRSRSLRLAMPSPSRSQPPRCSSQRPSRCSHWGVR